ncbi:piggyBac transposable element-derived protein 4-like [Triplophysa rosa]|uniref:piggyBac transposable element-derived protein 4-like n=1 Tax=Triplophysa rosa TaxID=992332 RepID=UPI002545DEAA|nr:piggyBac transposable element-derived protein 4-like [Triplophysa rosa]
MAKRMIKTKFTLDEVVEECTRRNSDQSEDDISDEESDVSSIDTVAEDLFLDGGDVTLDKQSNETDEDWEPSSKKPYTNRQDDSTSSEDKPQTSPTQRDSASKRPRGKGRARGRGKGRARGRGKGRARGRGRTASTSGQAEMSIPTSEERWNDVDVPDVTPPQPTFRPTKSPGPQLIRTANYTALQLFQLFFTNSVLLTIIKNTNDFGSTHHSNPSNPWIDVTVRDMLAFMAMVIYMGLIKLPSITDYWRESHLYSLPFPKTLLTGKKFLRICHSLHLSSLVDDAANEQRRGTSEFDRLCKIKPLYSEIRDACKINYHPGQEISIDERMVASKARIGIKQFMKNKPCRWGYKLFVLADSSNGYTWDFFVYEGKLQGNSGKGLSYESVMELVDTQLLGTGYKLFVDNFYTSPSLFCDLLQKRIWACGTIRTNRIGFPKTKINTLVSKSLRGSIRWIRKDSLLFVQWRDTRDVFMCTTLHTAHGGDTVQRRVKDADGHWVLKNISVPPAVKEYNRFMGGVDLSDSLINYYKVIHKTQRWYKTLFYHFMDIAIVNAFLLYKDLTKGKGEVPMHQKAFRETLVEELAAAAKIPAPSSTPRSKHHKPVHITAHSTMGRLRCRQCQAKTPVKCSSCDIPLCFVPNRDCYNEWHDANNL